ncbi:MAG: hypothetical protein QW115_03550 [Thermoplasmata archaeon]
MNKKGIMIICVVGVLAVAGLSLVILNSQTNEKKAGVPVVEFYEPNNGILDPFEQRYKGSEIYLSNNLNESAPTWNGYAWVHKSHIFVVVNNTSVVEDARKYGVVNGRLEKIADYWQVSDTNTGTSVRYFGASDDISESFIPVRVHVICGNRTDFPCSFISDQEAIKIAWNFVNTTVLSKIPHLSMHLTIKFAVLGYTNITGGSYINETIEKNVHFSLYYDGFWIGDILSVSLNATGHVIEYSMPTDFEFTPEKNIYVGTPQDILNYYKTHGINIGKNINVSTVTKVVIEKIEVSYKPDTENQSLKNPFERYVPYYYLKYTIHGRNGFSTVFYGSLYIKNSF